MAFGRRRGVHAASVWRVARRLRLRQTKLDFEHSSWRWLCSSWCLNTFVSLIQTHSTQSYISSRLYPFSDCSNSARSSRSSPSTLNVHSHANKIIWCSYLSARTHSFRILHFSFFVSYSFGSVRSYTLHLQSFRCYVLSAHFLCTLNSFSWNFLFVYFA